MEGLVQFFRKLVLEILANLMRKPGGVCMLSRSSHLNDICWEARGVFPLEKMFQIGEKGMA